MNRNPLNRPHRLEVFEDKAGEFRWRRKAGNSQVISTSGEGYPRKRDALRGLELANSDMEYCRFIDLTTDDPREEPEKTSS